MAKALLLNGSPNAKGCTYTALREIADVLEKEGMETHIVQVGTAAAWLGAACYCLQIFFDFSGYSDMAIGLGKCFGFTFCETFASTSQ